MRIFYKPTRAYLYADVLMLLLSFFVVLDWLPFTTNNPFQKYSWPSLVYSFTWFFSSYLFQRYKPLKKQPYLDSSLKLFYTTSVVFIVNMALIHIFYKRYSGFVLLTATSAVFAVNYTFLLLYYAYRLAVEYNEVSFKLVEERINAQVKPASTLDDKSLQQLRSIITAHSGDHVLSFLEKSIDLTSGNTMVRIKINAENLQMIPHYQFSTIVQLERLNNIRGINALFSVINEKLSDNGIFVCCFESKSTRKRRILMNYPKSTKYFFYALDYLYKRAMPKVIITHGLYYFITKGKDRILSKTEVLGRLYCFGFNIIMQKKVGKLTYIVAQRIKQPETVQKRIYGPLITLRRFGKNRKPIKVYKMRTMHPYSEYLQGYMFAQNNLKSGGKFNKDTRVSTIGSFLRKYWLDELPMIINLLKGDMKLVGVRPLSSQYFNLYCKELQEKRIKYKPGLLPPFYADMPHTLEEIQQSEMNYLLECEKNGVFLTDTRYFLRILKNILFHHARSA